MPKTSVLSSSALEEVFRRSARDTGFRLRLLATPLLAVNEVVSPSVPGSARLGFIERPSNVDALFVLPDAVGRSADLSDAELEAVAGGVDGGVCTSCGSTDECAYTNCTTNI